jgi:hypothetical protein
MFEKMASASSLASLHFSFKSAYVADLVFAIESPTIAWYPNASSYSLALAGSKPSARICALVKARRG